MRRADIAAALAGFERAAAAESEARPAAVGVVVVPGPAVLLTRRAPRMRAHAGQFALPGGATDPGESAEQAARRELAEELGLHLGPDAVLGLLDDYPTRSGFVITPVVLWAGEHDGPLHPEPTEVAEVFHIGFDVLDVDPVLAPIPESDRPVIRLPLRGIGASDGYLHAPTAAVLHQFREVVVHGRHTRVAHLEQPVFAWR